MKTLVKGNEIEYFTERELYDTKVCIQDDTRNYYKKIYNIAELISLELEIKCPDIFITTGALQARTGNFLQGYLPNVENCSLFEKRIVLLSTLNINENELIAVLAHEMRHIWQQEYKKLDNANEKVSGGENILNNKAEIDADGYSIYYLSSRLKISIEEAANIACKYEKQVSLKWYKIRIEKAKEIKNYYSKNLVNKKIEMVENNNSEPPKKLSLKEKIRSLLNLK